VLLEEISSLRRMVEKQNEMMMRLMKALEVRDLPNGHAPEVLRRRGKERDEEEEQFALGDDDENEDVR